MKQKKKLPTGSEAPLKKTRCTMNLSFLDTVEYERRHAHTYKLYYIIKLIHNNYNHNSKYIFIIIKLQIYLNYFYFSTITNMDITGVDTSNASTTHEIGHEDEEDVQNDEEQTQNIMSNLPSSSHAGKRIRSKEDKISAILAKRSKDTNDTILRIQEQNKLLAKNLCEEDDIDLFYKSIAMTVKKMPPQVIKEAKLKTLTLITEIDDKYSTRQTLPYQIPSDYNNMYQCKLSSPANSFSTSTLSQGFFPFNYGDESNA